MPTVIYGFPRGTPQRALSNFWERPFRFYGYDVWTGEAAFHIPKSQGKAYRRRVAAERDPQRAKNLGRAVTLRPDWDDEAVCCRAMVEVVRAKARGAEGFADYLLSTGDAILVEANTWDDRRWGVDWRTGLGWNRLGIALMFVRAELLAERHAETGALDAWPDDAWPRFPAEGEPHEDWSPAALAAGRYPRALRDDGSLALAA